MSRCKTFATWEPTPMSAPKVIHLRTQCILQDGHDTADKGSPHEFNFKHYSGVA